MVEREIVKLNLKTYLIIAALIAVLLTPIIKLPWEEVNYNSDGTLGSRSSGTKTVSLVEFIWMMNKPKK
jgi:hypothetical protein